jgi:hypothetical protein
VASTPHRFKVGDWVRVKPANPEGNPRTPHYCRTKVGIVGQLHGTCENPQDHRDIYPPLCTVVFEVAEIFGGSVRDKLYVDLHEEWLEPAALGER